MMDIEATRASYRPDRITTLFVGESAPASGDFFYFGNNNMLRLMQRATDAALVGDGEFLDRFKARGWFLDDLVLVPVDKLASPERKVKCLAAAESLGQRIAVYRPLAIVSLLASIRGIVERAEGGGQRRANVRGAVPRHGAAISFPQ